jgi:DNA primase
MLWMAVEVDEYELPIAVADSPASLARLMKVSRNAIYQKELAEKQGEVLKGYKVSRWCKPGR